MNYMHVLKQVKMPTFIITVLHDYIFKSKLFMDFVSDFKFSEFFWDMISYAYINHI